MTDEQGGGFMDQMGNPLAAMMSMMQGMQQGAGGLGDLDKAVELEQTVAAYGPRSPLIMYKSLLDMAPMLARVVEDEVGPEVAAKLMEVAKEVKEKFKEELRKAGKEGVADHVDKLYYRIDEEYKRLAGSEEVEVKSEG